MRSFLSLLLPAVACPVLAPAQGLYEREPIRYASAADDNAVSRLDRRLAAGAAELAPEGRSGRLLPLLRALGVPPASQTLVFSRTSLQRHRVSPRNPRALYFGPDVYVGWIPGAAAIEVAAGDERLGLVFYRLTQDPAQPARLVRDDSCLSCHAGSRTDDEPGLLLRSVFPDPDGDPIPSAGETLVTTSTTIEQRWGGWLLTGRFAGAHRGNGIAERAEPGTWRVAGRAAADLHAFAADFAADDYPVATSDVGALLALEQQVTVHNVLVRASIQARVALAADARWTEATGDAGMRTSTRRLLASLAREIASVLLLAGEPSLAGHDAAPDPAFATAFADLWPRDAAGVALGRLDLRERTFTLPLSPMVHAPAFAALPAELRGRVLERLRLACGEGRLMRGVAMTPPQRTALHAHLTATLPGYGAR